MLLILQNPAIMQDLLATDLFLAKKVKNSCIFAGFPSKLASILKK